MHYYYRLRCLMENALSTPLPSLIMTVLKIYLVFWSMKSDEWLTEGADKTTHSLVCFFINNLLIIWLIQILLSRWIRHFLNEVWKICFVYQNISMQWVGAFQSWIDVYMINNQLFRFLFWCMAFTIVNSIQFPGFSFFTPRICIDFRSYAMICISILTFS